jgi:5-formyltetrahydrofolate cyclo-ligase
VDRSHRRRLREARRALSRRQQRNHAEAIVKRLRGMREFRSAPLVAAYIAADGEPDLSALWSDHPDDRRRWCLPVLHPLGHRRLWFVRREPADAMVANRFGIPEPVARRGRIQPLHSLNLILLPLVGFDLQCNRVGMGAGFYDRTLAPLRRRSRWRRPRLIGVAHECQRVECIEPRPWDVPLDAVVTEAGVYRCRSGDRQARSASGAGE